MKESTKVYYKYSLILSLSILLGFLFAATFYIASQLNKHGNDPEVLKLSNQQLVLSEKLTKQATKTSLNQDFENRSTQISRIEKTLSSLKTNNNLLRGQSKGIQISGINNNDILRKYIELESQLSILETDVNEFINSIFSEESQLTIIEKFNELEKTNKSFFSSMKEINSYYSSAIEKRTGYLKYTIFFIFLIFVTLSLILWKLIVQPTSSKIKDEIDHLKEEVSELTSISKESIQKIELKNKILQSFDQETRVAINGIIGVTEILLDTKLNDVQKEYLNSLNNSALQIQTLLDDAVDLSKIDQGNFEIKTSYLDLRRIIEDCTENLANKAESKNSLIVTKYPANQETHFIGDPKRIRQVITNLLNVFLEITDKSCIEIDVVSEINDELDYQANVEILISVQSELNKQITNLNDLSNSSLELIFQTAQKLANLMDGTISLQESNKNATLEIKLEIPLPVDKNFNRKTNENIQNTAKNFEILIVDNKQENRENLLDSIKSWDFEVSATTNFDYAVINAANLKNGKSKKLILIINLYENIYSELEKVLEISNSEDCHLIISLPFSAKQSIIQDTRYKNIKFLFRPIKITQILDYCCDFNNHKNNGSNSVSYKLNCNLTDVKALVVEENLINQKVISHLLQKLGCVVSVAINGTKAIEELKNEKYEIVFINTQMMDMNGYQVTEEIRCSKNLNSNIPIIGITNSLSESDKQKCLQSGMNYFIERPIKYDDLESALVSYVPQAKCSLENFLTQGELKNISNENYVYDIIDQFVNATKEDVESLNKAVSENDFKSLKYISNRMKGSAAQLGASRLQSICEELEEKSSQSSIKEVTDLHQNLINELKQIQIKN